MINGYSTDGPNASISYYDTPEYDPFWQTVQRLNAKIYFHPREAEDRQLWQDFPELRGNIWGFSLETGEHMLRFILSGFFDKFPGITFIIGHNGEMITYWADRIDHR
jgi:2,3-dihydroxybenzoate decarboxylase